MPFTKNDTTYQFIRFKDGKEVFAMARDVGDTVELHFPMNINLQPAVTGGVLVHLGPHIPFTTDDYITVDNTSILYRTSISEQFINFYDEACTAWLDLRDNEKIEIKSSKQVFKEQQETIQELVKKRFEEVDFRDELDQMIEDFEEEKYRLEQQREEGPDPDDTIH
tara:strand:- start:731 stop:1228 length:498 start_codon:yes stop_codon:yes gene_type:complete